VDAGAFPVGESRGNNNWTVHSGLLETTRRVAVILSAVRVCAFGLGLHERTDLAMKLYGQRTF
jgi:hypothetical protein